ncbi:MAG: TetR/AcrR family transcriptional regulator, partial [Clostridium sp.]
LSAAYNLFISRGVEKTSIDDIAKTAKLGKGTFYLYFKDKSDILYNLILKKSNEIIKEGLKKTEKLENVDFKEKTLVFIDYIIEVFENNKPLLKLIKKNISTGVYKKAINSSEEYADIQLVLDIFIKSLIEEGADKEEAEITLFMIIELVGSISYTSIIFNEPADINTVKPILFRKIRTMLESKN